MIEPFLKPAVMNNAKKSISKNKNGLDWILFYQIQERQKVRNRLSKIADGRVQNEKHISISNFY